MAKKLLKKIELVAPLEARYTEVLGLGQGDYGIARSIASASCISTSPRRCSRRRARSASTWISA